MATDFALVITACADRAEAEKIARLLVESQRAACVQMLPIESVYTWQGKTEAAQEILLLCKIKHADYAEVESAIRAAHSYEVPEIVEIGIEQGAASYLAWIAAVTRS
jgi:periplasmic divalent cation tolerance protein